MSRSCATCQDLKRPEIDRRLAAGEPATQIARDYELNPSSLHRHRVNCLKLGSSNKIKKEAAQGTAAVTLLPSRETLSGAFMKLCDRVDQIVEQAKQEGSLSTALSGLNSIRQTLNSLVRLAGHDRPAALDAVEKSHTDIDIAAIAERLIKEFDHDPDVKARIASALLKMDAPLGVVNGNAGANSGVLPMAQAIQPTPAPSAAVTTTAAGPTQAAPLPTEAKAQPAPTPAEAQPVPKPGAAPELPAGGAS